MPTLSVHVWGSQCMLKHLHHVQEESIEYVASTIQSLLQQDAAADDSAAEAVAVAEGGAAEAGCEDAEAAAAAREAGADEAAAAVAGSQQQQQQRGADEGAKPSARGRFKRLYLIAVSAAGRIHGAVSSAAAGSISTAADRRVHAWQPRKQ